MNLYIFNETRRGAVYGVGTYIRELTAALKGSNVNVCVVNLVSDKPQIQKEEIDGTRYWTLPAAITDQLILDRPVLNPSTLDQLTIEWQKQRENYFRNVVYWLQLHIKDKKDLIFHLNYYESSKLAEELKKTFVCRIVSVAHFSNWGFTVYDNLLRLRNILNEEPADSLGKKLKKSFEQEKACYLKSDRVICLSKYMQEILCHDYGVDANKISVVPNGLADVTESTISNEHLREKWNIPAKEKIILFATRIDQVKGMVYLIKAFREVLQQFPDCRLMIAGSGDYDMCFKEAVEICAKITFTGLLEQQDLYELYRIADVGVVPSLFEPFGYVAVELMMHGLPIVATATSGLNEVIDDTCGFKIPLIVQPENVEIDATVLSEKILFLLKHPAEAKQMGDNGRKRYLDCYSSNLFRDNMLNVYQSLYQRHEDGGIKTLIVTGQHNHPWEVSHSAIKQILENSGLFTVDVAVSPEAGGNMLSFRPDFASYQLVVLDYCGDRWQTETEHLFLNYVAKGGGVVIYHAANNAFRRWKAYNQIIGFGGWENRNETDGSYIYLKDGELVYVDTPGRGGSHGSQHEFTLHCGNPDHPVTKGLPAAWRHAQDELYDRMRGPGIVKDVLYWAYSDPETRGSGRDELAVFTVDFGEARIFHTTLGHAGNTLDNNIAMQCAGFQVTLLRGAEWAATGKVTQPVPDDFPTETTISLRKNYKQNLL